MPLIFTTGPFFIHEGMRSRTAICTGLSAVTISDVLCCSGNLVSCRSLNPFLRPMQLGGNE